MAKTELSTLSSVIEDMYLGVFEERLPAHRCGRRLEVCALKVYLRLGVCEDVLVVGAVDHKKRMENEGGYIVDMLTPDVTALAVMQLLWRFQ